MEIKVGHNNYRVLDDPMENDEGRKGVTYPQKSEIRLDPGVSEPIYRETLLHEVQHAIASHAGISGELTEEEWITRMTPSLLTVLRENPEFVKTLLK
jgi:hypothetical protein